VLFTQLAELHEHQARKHHGSNHVANHQHVEHGTPATFTHATSRKASKHASVRTCKTDHRPHQLRIRTPQDIL
jgi:hypothetical protein